MLRLFLLPKLKRKNKCKNSANFWTRLTTGIREAEINILKIILYFKKFKQFFILSFEQLFQSPSDNQDLLRLETLSDLKDLLKNANSQSLEILDNIIIQVSILKKGQGQYSELFFWEKPTQQCNQFKHVQVNTVNMIVIFLTLKKYLSKKILLNKTKLGNFLLKFWTPPPKLEEHLLSFEKLRSIFGFYYNFSSCLQKY